MKVLLVEVETMIVLEATVDRLSGAATIQASLLSVPRIYQLLFANPVVSG